MGSDVPREGRKREHRDGLQYQGTVVFEGLYCSEFWRSVLPSASPVCDLRVKRLVTCMKDESGSSPEDRSHSDAARRLGFHQAFIEPLRPTSRPACFPTDAIHLATLLGTHGSSPNPVGRESIQRKQLRIT